MELVEAYARECGVSLRTAQRHRRNGDAGWLEFVAGRVDAVGDAGLVGVVADVGAAGVEVLSPVCHAQLIYDEAFREWQECVGRVKYVRDPAHRHLVSMRVDLPLAQRAVNIAVGNMDKARELLQSAQLADGRLVDRGSLQVLEAGLAQVFAELNRLPAAVGVLFGAEDAGRVEGLVFGVLEDRIKPVMERVFSGLSCDG